MTTFASAPQRPRAFWADIRFLLGIVLVVASVSGVWAVIVMSRTTAPMLTASRTLVAGETVTADDVAVAEVGLGQTGGGYLAAGALEPGAVVSRTIGAGELLPADAIVPAGAVQVTTVMIETTGEVPAAVDVGATVEVWAAAPEEGGQYAEPRILVPAATVRSVAREQSVMGSSGTTVELVIDRADVAATLSAISAGSRVSVVPAVGSSR